MAATSRSGETAAIRHEIDRILEKQYGPEFRDLARRMVGLIKIGYRGADREVIDDVMRRFRRAFQMNDADIEAAAGLPRVSVGVDAAQTREKQFDKLTHDGLLGKYIEWSQQHEAATQYHFASFLTAVVASFERKPLLDWQASPLFPNLYTLLVGPTAARKSSAMKLAARVVAKARPTLYQLPCEGTHQGFARMLRRRQRKTGKVSDGLILASEFSVLVSADPNKADLARWLTDWYECEENWARALKGEDDVYEIENLYVSVIGGSNMAWLKTLPGSAVTGGFLPRFLVFTASDRRHWKAFPEFEHALEKEIIDALSKVEVPDAMGFDAESKRYNTVWYEVETRAQYDKTTDEQFRAWLSRKQTLALKLAVAWQVLDGGPTDAVHVEWMEKACALVDWCDAPVREIYEDLGGTPETAAVSALMRSIHKHGGALPQSRIIRMMRNDYRKIRILEALQTLKAAGMLSEKFDDINGIVWSVTDG